MSCDLIFNMISHVKINGDFHVFSPHTVVEGCRLPVATADFFRGVSGGDSEA